MVTINGIAAELGSAAFNLQFVWENKGTKWLYFVGMFLSNNIVLAFAIMIFWIDDLSTTWCAGYIVIVALLYILRTEHDRRMETWLQVSMTGGVEPLGICLRAVCHRGYEITPT